MVASLWTISHKTTSVITHFQTGKLVTAVNPQVHYKCSNIKVKIITCTCQVTTQNTLHLYQATTSK